MKTQGFNIRSQGKMFSYWKTSYLLKSQMMERNIILLQPWPLVKLQVLNVFNYLESEDKNHTKRWFDQNIQKSMNMPPKSIKQSKYIIKQVTQQKGFTAKAVLTIQMFSANKSSPSHISSGGRSPTISTGQTHGGQL